MDTYADDVAAVSTTLDRKDAIQIGHSTGGGEVTRYVAKYGKGRVAKAVLISAIPPTFMQSAKNPDGVPKEAVDNIRDGTANHRAQFYKDITIPFYGFNRPGAVVSGSRDRTGKQGMMGAAIAHYECVKVLSETEFYDDLAAIDIPVLVLHGEDDQICPFSDNQLPLRQVAETGQAQILPRPAARHAYHPCGGSSTPIYWNLLKSRVFTRSAEIMHRWIGYRRQPTETTRDRRLR